MHKIKRSLLIFNHLVPGASVVILHVAYSAYSVQIFFLFSLTLVRQSFFLRLFFLLDLAKLGQRRVASVPVRFVYLVCVLVS